MSTPEHSRTGIRTAMCGGIEIAYETYGSSAEPPIVLVMGLATQMLGWPHGFCKELAARGFQVVRFDNRDIGLSTHLDDLGMPDLTPILADGHLTQAPYLLRDMADDTIGLLDALGLRRVHLVGASMGGMIAQEVAIRRPDRLFSLTSIMSTTAPHVGAPTEAAMAALMTPPATDEKNAGERAVSVYQIIGSPGYPLDEQAVRARGEESFRRAHDPMGVARQFAAIFASGDRTRQLQTVQLPTLVIHGLDDPLVQVAGGVATADAVPESRLVSFRGMGHDLPEPLWASIADEIAQHAHRSTTTHE